MNLQLLDFDGNCILLENIAMLVGDSLVTGEMLDMSEFDSESIDDEDRGIQQSTNIYKGQSKD